MNFATSFLKSSRSSTSQGERGWALVMVLWALAILAMMAAAGEALTVATARVEHRAFDKARIDADFHAAVIRAVLALDDPRLAARWRIDGVPEKFLFDGLPMQVSVQEQDGLIDINQAPPDVLTRVFTASGLSKDAAEKLAANIVDWREPVGGDDPTRPEGTTDNLYASLPYHPRHNAFQSVGELELVSGMTPALYARVAPWLTVYSHEGDVDLDVAPAAVLLALNGGDATKVATLMRARENPASDDGKPPPPPGVLSPDETSWGHAFSVTVVAYPNGRRIVRRAVVQPTGDENVPLLVEAWQ